MCKLVCGVWSACHSCPQIVGELGNGAGVRKLPGPEQNIQSLQIAAPRTFLAHRVLKL